MRENPEIHPSNIVCDYANNGKLKLETKILKFLGNQPYQLAPIKCAYFEQILNS